MSKKIVTGLNELSQELNVVNGEFRDGARKKAIIARMLIEHRGGHEIDPVRLMEVLNTWVLHKENSIILDASDFKLIKTVCDASQVWTHYYKAQALELLDNAKDIKEEKEKEEEKTEKTEVPKESTKA